MKADVAAFTHDVEEISGLCEQWGLPLPLHSHKRLFGGYSGSNYRVEAADGSVAVLKICHGYSSAEVEAQARIMAHLRAGGFDGACSALPLATGLISKLSTALGLGGERRFVTLTKDGSPACLLSFVDGVAADKVISAKHVPSETVLHAVGEGLGRMHSVPCPPGSGLRSILDGGGCDLRKHVSDVYGDSVSSCAAISGHEFLPIYFAQREKLRASLATDGLPQGPLHGDPFLDNVLVDASTGELRGASQLALPMPAPPPLPSPPALLPILPFVGHPAALPIPDPFLDDVLVVASTGQVRGASFLLCRCLPRPG
jgi:hypothetical protein